jgi:hypothetical protein
VTFKTRFKIGEMVVIKGKPHKIVGVRLEVSADSKMIFYRCSSRDGTTMQDITEEDLLLENLLEKK